MPPLHKLHSAAYFFARPFSFAVLTFCLFFVFCAGPSGIGASFSLAAQSQQEDDIFDDGPGAAAYGKRPVFTILYNAMSMGEIHPCPT